ncbi:MAG: hypothetical protein HY391_05100 [Deltaproteobacteria bacterium]|nr:hypothetical protein [Deltaproteobacteria bacterium]
MKRIHLAVLALLALTFAGCGASERSEQSTTEAPALSEQLVFGQEYTGRTLMFSNEHKRDKFNSQMTELRASLEKEISDFRTALDKDETLTPEQRAEQIKGKEAERDVTLEAKSHEFRKALGGDIYHTNVRFESTSNEIGGKTEEEILNRMKSDTEKAAQAKTDEDRAAAQSLRHFAFDAGILMSASDEEVAKSLVSLAGERPVVAYVSVHNEAGELTVGPDNRVFLGKTLEGDFVANDFVYSIRNVAVEGSILHATCDEFAGKSISDAVAINANRFGLMRLTKPEVKPEVVQEEQPSESPKPEETAAPQPEAPEQVESK